MVDYTKYPGVDDNHNFAPEVRRAFAASREFQEGFRFALDEAKTQQSSIRVPSTAGLGLRIIGSGGKNAVYQAPTPTFEVYDYAEPCIIRVSFSFMWMSPGNAAATIVAELDGATVHKMRIHNHMTQYGQWVSSTISGEAFIPSAGKHIFRIRADVDTQSNAMQFQDFDGSMWIQKGLQFVFDGPSSDGIIPVSVTAPEDPEDGDVWWDSVTGQLKRYDGTMLREWVPEGEPAPNSAYQGLALGRGQVSAAFAIAAGAESSASGVSSVVIGNRSTDNGQNSSVVIGEENKVEASTSMAIGSYARAYGYNSIAIGRYPTVGLPGESTADDSIAIGHYSNAEAHSSLAIGPYSTVLGSSDYSVAIGGNSRVDVPEESTWTDGGLAVGYGAGAFAAETVASGYYSGARKDGSTALGAYADAREENSIALGRHSDALHPRSVAIGHVTTDFPDQALMGVRYLELYPLDWENPPVDDHTAMVLRSPNGTRFAITVNDEGVVSSTPFENPEPSN